MTTGGSHSRARMREMPQVAAEQIRNMVQLDSASPQ